MLYVAGIFFKFFDQVIPAHTVENIIDIQFLHGYNQPTLLILYEPLRYEIESAYLL
jgi:hypothetical protein